MLREEQVVQWREITEDDWKFLGTIVEENTSKTPTKAYKDRKHFHAVGVTNYIPDEMMTKA